MEKTLNIDEALYQKLVSFYTENYNLPPLAAKIFVYFSFDYDNEGVTFDDLVEVLNFLFLLHPYFLVHFINVNNKKFCFLAIVAFLRNLLIRLLFLLLNLQPLLFVQLQIQKYQETILHTLY